ncbi:hypothetical protein DXG03_008571 [Asterophora parasitica]|uniref:Uncharacterized protein n=1 Tax=Asterophora parasitica TaxID=117018 RepID=A0A9P7G7M3_9AGAR|nr:hypothetical protein DXG03_008571 [Asterophora parasitica]
MSRTLRPRKSKPSYTALAGIELDDENGQPIAGPSKRAVVLDEDESGSDFAPENEPDAQEAEVEDEEDEDGKPDVEEDDGPNLEQSRSISRRSTSVLGVKPRAAVKGESLAASGIKTPVNQKLRGVEAQLGARVETPDVTDRVNKSWGYNVGAGPLWEMVEDRGWYKEAVEDVPDMDRDANRRPKVYKNIRVKEGWEVLRKAEAVPYLPTDVVIAEEGNLKPPPPVSCLLGPFGKQTERQLEMFQSQKMSEFMSESSAHIFNAGAPVWGIDWCPIHADDREAHSFKQYLAVAPFPTSSHSPEIGVRVARPSHACLQIWSLGPSAAAKSSTGDQGEMKCEMVLCVEGGPAHELKWCPLPANDDAKASIRPRKLGLLGGVFEDGTWSAYAVPHPADVKTSDHDPSQPIYGLFLLFATVIELEETNCWTFDWGNSELLAIGTTNGIIAVYDLGPCLKAIDSPNHPLINDLLPTHYLTVHQSAIRALAWIRAPPATSTGTPRTNGDPTVITSGGYDGMECMTDIREGHGSVMNRTRDVINAMAFSPFGGGPVTIDHENIVKAYSASPSMLGRGHTLLEPQGPPFFIHKIYQLDYSRKEGKYRMLDRFLPQETQDRPAVKVKTAKETSSDKDPAKERLKANSVGTGAWPREVGVHRVTWNSSNGLAASGLLASATASGLCRVDELWGRWIKGKVPYGGIEHIRRELDDDAMELQRHSLEAANAHDRVVYLERENELLRSELSVLRAHPHPDALPQAHPAALQVQQLTLSLRRLNDKLSLTEEALLERTTQLALATEEATRAKFTAESAYELAARTRGREEAGKLRELELEWKVKAVEEAAKMSDLVVNEYADLVRSWEFKAAARSPLELHSSSTTLVDGPSGQNSGANSSLPDSLSEGKMGLQRLLSEFSVETEKLHTDLLKAQAELAASEAKREGEKKSTEQCRLELAQAQFELQKLKIDDNAAAKMVSRYMEEKMREELERWARRAEEALRRANADPRVIQDRMILDAHTLLENTLGGVEADSQGSAARLITAQSVVEALTAELERETGRRLELEMVLADTLTASECNTEDPIKPLPPPPPVSKPTSPEIPHSVSRPKTPSSTSASDAKRAEAGNTSLSTIAIASQELPTAGDIVEEARTNLSGNITLETEHLLEHPLPPTIPPLDTSRNGDAIAEDTSPSLLSDSLRLSAEDQPSTDAPAPFITTAVSSPVVVAEQYDAFSEASLPQTPPASESEALSSAGNGEAETNPLVVEVALVDDAGPAILAETATPSDVESVLPNAGDSKVYHLEEERQEGVVDEVQFISTETRLSVPKDTLPSSPPLPLPATQELDSKSSLPLPTPHEPDPIPKDTPAQSPLLSTNAPPAPSYTLNVEEVPKPPPHPLVAELAKTKHRYDDIQRALRDCHLGLETLSSSVSASLDSKVPAGPVPPDVLRTVLQRLKDYTEDARVELEIRVADEELAVRGYETLLSVPGALSSPSVGPGEDDSMSHSDVVHQIADFVSGADPSVAKAVRSLSRKLEDIQHDIAALKRAVHDEVVAPSPPPTPSDTNGSASGGGWTSWIRSGPASPASPGLSAGPAPTFGSVMTTPRLRHSPSLNFQGRRVPSSIEAAKDPFASLGLRIPMPSYMHHASAQQRQPQPRSRTLSTMYMLGLGARRPSGPLAPSPIASPQKKLNGPPPGLNRLAGAGAGAASETEDETDAGSDDEDDDTDIE